jgi:hypothetical protein
MPTNGLSLLGFMDQNTALNHLKVSCLPDPTKSDAQLLADWVTAKTNKGPPFANAGWPSMSTIPLSEPHLKQLIQQSRWTFQIQGLLAAGASFQLIEVDPLLAFQFVVDLDRSNHHCGTLTRPPNQQELMELCLPIAPTPDAIHASIQGQSALIRSRSLNLRLQVQGPLPGIPNSVGVQFDWAMPFVHVVRFNQRCYLHNGFHRTYGARLAGATHVPCIFRDVSQAGEIGIGPGTFDLAILESADAPTLGHFTRGSAWAVRLRAASRIIQVNWSDHIMLRNEDFNDQLERFGMFPMARAKEMRWVPGYELPFQLGYHLSERDRA